MKRTHTHTTALTVKLIKTFKITLTDAYHFNRTGGFQFADGYLFILLHSFITITMKFYGFQVIFLH